MAETAMETVVTVAMEVTDPNLLLPMAPMVLSLLSLTVTVLMVPNQLPSTAMALVLLLPPAYQVLAVVAVLLPHPLSMPLAHLLPAGPTQLSLPTLVLPMLLTWALVLPVLVLLLLSSCKLLVGDLLGIVSERTTKLEGVWSGLSVDLRVQKFNHWISVCWSSFVLYLLNTWLWDSEILACIRGVGKALML